MTMPKNFVLVRHGESVGNVANHQSKQGDNSAFTEDFLASHSATWGLTEKGKEQAISAGKWLREESGLVFDKFYTSEYVRTAQTAMLLGLPTAEWYLYFLLHERDWGDWDVMTYEDKQKLFAKSFDQRRRNPFYWTPPNGESMTHLCLRSKDVLGTLHRQYSNENVIFVCHGEVIMSYRVDIERLTTTRFKEIDRSRNPHDKIHNCQIIHYTRIDPVSGIESSHLDWMRSICPWDMSLSSNGWQRIERPRFSNDGLQEEIDRMIALSKDEVDADE